MTYTIRLEGQTEKILGKRLLADTRVQACAIAKKNPGKGVSIYDPSKMFTHPIEVIIFYRNHRIITGDLLNGYYIRQWEKNRTRRVSATNGSLLDLNRNWKWA